MMPKAHFHVASTSVWRLYVIVQFHGGRSFAVASKVLFNSALHKKLKMVMLYAVNTPKMHRTIPVRALHGDCVENARF